MTKAEDGSVVLEGVFTEIGVKNKNNRIYEEAEVLPHINELKEKVKTNKLLGELDHPKDFDISLSNVSHVIEDLDYDSDKKQVLGRIRLLNTSKGKEAQALIEDGIPLHISSRAAGTVDEAGKVKIKKFFTYDLVADPGFENAELARVNESFGFENTEGLYIYEMDSSEDEINKTNKTDLTMENTSDKFVTVEDFNKYTEYVKNTLDGVKESANSNNDELIEKLVKYTEHIAEKVNQVTDYTEYLSENLDKSISHSDYLAENIDKIKNYASYLGEELDSSIQYTEHVAEQADKGIA
jgi:methyl-accepting chemotaxis protein